MGCLRSHNLTASVLVSSDYSSIIPPCEDDGDAEIYGQFHAFV